MKRGDDVSIVTENIKRILNDTGMKQKTIAARGNYKEKDFSAMVCGRKKIYAEDVPNIAAALGVSPNDLFKVG